MKIFIYGLTSISLALLAFTSSIVNAGTNPHLGQIMMVGFDYCPKDWLSADGQLIPIDEYQSLYDIYGTTYGGDGETNFGIPDLRSSISIGTGAGDDLTERYLGEAGGEESVALDAESNPSHSHTLRASSEPPTSFDKLDLGSSALATTPETTPIYTNVGTDSPLGDSIGYTGEGIAHDNMPPFLVINFCVATKIFVPEIPAEPEAPEKPQELMQADLVGNYQYKWLEGSISLDNGQLWWADGTGASWTLEMDTANEKLYTDEGSPYFVKYPQTHEYKVLRKDGRVTGFVVWGVTYQREEFDASRQSEQSTAIEETNTEVEMPTAHIDQVAEGCEQHGQIVSEWTDRETQITITNGGIDNLNVYWINLYGEEVNYHDENAYSVSYNGEEVYYLDEPSPLSSIVSGDTVEFSAFRGYVFSVLTDSGECIGIVKPREPRNSYTFGQ